MIFEGFQGALDCAPKMPRDNSLSNSYMPYRCCYTNTWEKEAEEGEEKEEEQEDEDGEKVHCRSRSNNSLRNRSIPIDDY